MTFQTARPLRHQSLNATNRPADFFVYAVTRGDMLLDTQYQRGDVWTNTQQMGLVRSWLTGNPIPAVIINDRMSHAWKTANPSAASGLEPAYAVIDGRQRIATAVAWLTGILAVPASWFNPEYLDTIEDTDDGPYVRFTGLTIVGRRFINHRCLLPCAEGHLPTVEAEAEMYMIVNGGGTPQTSADMDRAAQVAARIDPTT